MDPSLIYCVTCSSRSPSQPLPWARSALDSGSGGPSRLSPHRTAVLGAERPDPTALSLEERPRPRQSRGQAGALSPGVTWPPLSPGAFTLPPHQSQQPSPSHRQVTILAGARPGTYDTAEGGRTRRRERRTRPGPHHHTHTGSPSPRTPRVQPSPDPTAPRLPQLPRPRGHSPARGGWPAFRVPGGPQVLGRRGQVRRPPTLMPTFRACTFLASRPSMSPATFSTSF